MGRKRLDNFTTRFFFQEFQPEHYWILGWFYSDGCNYKSTASICVHANDHEVLEKISNILHCKPPKIIRNNTLSLLRICSSTFCEKLTELGCVKNKSLIIKYPTFIKDINHHKYFLRGVFEGDGSFYYTGNRLSSKCEIASGSLEFLLSIKYIIYDILNIKCSLKYTKNNKVRALIIGDSFRDTHKFLSFIYNGCDENLILKRKFLLWKTYNEKIQNPPLKNTKNININRFRLSFYIKSPNNQIYFSDTLTAFAKEMNLSKSNLRNVIIKRYGFKSIKGWIVPLEEEIKNCTDNIIFKYYY